MLVDFARTPSPTPIIRGLEFFNRLKVRFQAYVAHFTLEGKPRQNRTYSTYKNSTFPTMEDQLLFILNYINTSDSFD
jgi:hypothetical protein